MRLVFREIANRDVELVYTLPIKKASTDASVQHRLVSSDVYVLGKRCTNEH